MASKSSSCAQAADEQFKCANISKDPCSAKQIAASGGPSCHTEGLAAVREPKKYIAAEIVDLPPVSDSEVEYLHCFSILFVR